MHLWCIGPGTTYAIQHLDAWFSFGVPSAKRHGKTGENSAEGHWVGEDKHLTYEQKLRNLGLISPEKGRVGRVTAAPSNNEEGIKMTDMGNSMSLSS